MVCSHAGAPANSQAQSISVVGGRPIDEHIRVCDGRSAMASAADNAHPSGPRDA
jgi:hypothetical protein